MQGQNTFKCAKATRQGVQKRTKNHSKANIANSYHCLSARDHETYDKQ